MSLLDLPDELLVRILGLVLGEEKITLLQEKSIQRIRQFRCLCLASIKLNCLATQWLQSQEIYVSMVSLERHCELLGPTPTLETRTTDFLLEHGQKICADFYPSYRLEGYILASLRLWTWKATQPARTIRFSVPPDYRSLPKLVPSEAWRSFCLSLLPAETPIKWSFDFSGPDYAEAPHTPVLWKAVEEQREEIVHSIIRLAPDTAVAPSAVQHLALHALECSSPSIFSAVLDLKNVKLADGYEQLLNSALLLASLQGKDAMIRILAQRGANVHGLGPPATPMFCAMARNHDTTILLLRSLGATV